MLYSHLLSGVISVSPFLRCCDFVHDPLVHFIHSKHSLDASTNDIDTLIREIT